MRWANLTGRAALVSVASAGLLVVVLWVLFPGDGQPSGDLGPVGDIPNRVVSGLDQDIPCIENADGSLDCATPLPSLTAADRASGLALTLEGIVVELDHLGAYRVSLGQAVLARGIVQESVLQLGNVGSGAYRAPSFMLLFEDASSHKVLPRNIYAKGVTDGPQRVDVYLVFDLEWYRDGASIDVSRVVVR
jgi:hypothetical protein